MKQKQRHFVDMDGTLTFWKTVDHLEELYEEGFFALARPQEKVIEAERMLIAEGKCEVFVLSAFLLDSKYALMEKNEWLDRHLPEINKAHRIFVPIGVEKAEYVPFGIRPSDTLLDDYSKNLHEWSQWGAGAIKLINGVNGTNGTWQAKGGAATYAHLSPERIKHDIERAMKKFF